LTGAPPGAGLLWSRSYSVKKECGKKVVMIDSRISRKKGGRLSCVEINGNEITAHYSKRNSAGEKIADLEMKKLKKKNGEKS
jgi:hypothetical protein